MARGQTATKRATASVAKEEPPLKKRSTRSSVKTEDTNGVIKNENIVSKKAKAAVKKEPVDNAVPSTSAQANSSRKRKASAPAKPDLQVQIKQEDELDESPAPKNVQNKSKGKKAKSEAPKKMGMFYLCEYQLISYHSILLLTNCHEYG